MIDIKKKENCTGCFACVNICPKSCITMNSDKEGFWYPCVDNSACIKCGKCSSVCPVKKNTDGIYKVQNTFAAINNDLQERDKSSSGGVFSLLAKFILKNGGIVIGAAFSEDFKSVYHICIDSSNELHRLQGSKYLQSKINDCFKKAEDFLKNGKVVLFTGTPCQIAGLKAYLKKKYANLYTQDIVCHGVCSPSVWKKYAQYRQAQLASKLKSVAFRDKGDSWRNYHVNMSFENGTCYRQRASEDIYMKCFLKNLTLRPSCYRCKFKSANSSSDITLADFWGIHRIDEKMYDDKGTSLVMIRTQKGKTLFEQCCENCNIKSELYLDALRENPSIIRSAKKNPKRKKFMSDLETKPIEKVLSKYAKTAPWSVINSKLKWYMKKIIFLSERRRKE